MKPAIVLAVLLAASWTTPVASAAEALLTDNAGDTQMSATVAVDSPGAPYAHEQSQSTDLLALDVAETDDDLQLTLTVSNLAGDFTGSEYHVDFSWRDRQYRAVMMYFKAPPAALEIHGWVLVASGTDFDWVAYTGAEAFPEKNQVSMKIPKVYILDTANAPPGRGDTITGIKVNAERELDFGNFIVPLPKLRITDQMPDSGEGGSFTFALGDYSTGNLRLSSPEPVRVSNGGSTTFVFKVTLRNLGEAEDEYALDVLDIPHDWNVTFQSPIKVPGKSEKTVSILASVPFGHTHGGFDAFNVTAASKKDSGSQGKLKMGVLHTPIPMPAGHHSELYLHAQDPRDGGISEAFAIPFPFAFGWMDTMADHSTDHPFMSPNSYGNNDGQQTLGWWIGLGSGMSMGMDFDIEKTGTITGSILTGYGSSKMAAALYYFREGANDDERILLAEAPVIDLVLDPQTSTPFSLTLNPTPESDYVPYEGPANLVLHIELAVDPAFPTFNTNFQPRLNVEDFVMKLPLLEYHDKLTGSTDAMSGIEIVAEGLVEKAALPGNLATYTFHVKNTGPTGKFVVQAAGIDASRARIVPRGIIDLESGESKKITVGVDVPFDANDGDQLEVLLFVHAREDPSKMVVARTNTIVTRIATEAAPDETGVLLAAQQEQKKTPGPGLALVALVALGVALARRR